MTASTPAPAAQSAPTVAERNAAGHARLEQELADLVARTSLGGPERSRERHTGRGKLLVRDRIDALLDEGSPFLEVGALAAHGLYGGDSPAAGVVAGIGLVHGRLVMVVGVGVHGHRADAEAAQGADDAHGDLAAVGHQHGVEQGRPLGVVLGHGCLTCGTGRTGSPAAGNGR